MAFYFKKVAWVLKSVPHRDSFPKYLFFFSRSNLFILFQEGPFVPRIDMNFPRTDTNSGPAEAILKFGIFRLFKMLHLLIKLQMQTKSKKAAKKSYGQNRRCRSPSAGPAIFQEGFVKFKQTKQRKRNTLTNNLYESGSYKKILNRAFDMISLRISATQTITYPSKLCATCFANRK